MAIHYSFNENKTINAVLYIADKLKIFEQENNINHINVSINIVGYKVIESNQDSVNNNIYTWSFDRSDKERKNITIKFKKENSNIEIDPSDNKTEPNKVDSKYTMYIFYGILLLVIIIGYLIFRKMKESNDINNI